jgi:hypothetical protein
MSLELLETTEIEFPFGPLPETQEAKDWLMELDFVDVHECSLEELEGLLATAPTPRIRAWIVALIEFRKEQRLECAWQVQVPVPDSLGKNEPPKINPAKAKGPSV